jgi:5-oxoprolinase (ATP-hydrolysing) subunit A
MELAMAVAINCDMGESFGLYKLGDDEGIMPHITVANVACGFHASDPVVMHKTVRLAKQYGVKVGAHPSLPDLQGFGRREMTIPRAELTDLLIYQIGALQGFLGAEGVALNHIKPHGVLYGMAARQEDVAHAVCDAADVFGVPLFGMAGTQHEKVYRERGFPFVSEFYADLDYDEKGGLIITREHVAVDPRQAAERSVRAVKEGKTTSIAGNDVSVRADTVCVHSDTPNAVEIARAVREGLAPFMERAD